MLEVKVNKEDLQVKIQEELSKLESEWGDLLYKYSEGDLVEQVRNSVEVYDIWFREIYCKVKELDLEVEEYRYLNKNTTHFREASLVAIRRKDKLLNLLSMFKINYEDIVTINESTYNFIYTESVPQKPTYQPFEESEAHERLLQRQEEITKRNVETNILNKPTPTREYQQPTSQEALWLLWLIGSIVSGIILIFAFK